MDEALLRVAEARLGMPLSGDSPAFERFRATPTGTKKASARLLRWLDDNSESLQQWLNGIELDKTERERIGRAYGRHRDRVKKFLLDPTASDFTFSLNMLSDLDVVLMSIEPKLDLFTATTLRDARQIGAECVGKRASETIAMLEKGELEKKLSVALDRFGVTLREGWKA